MGHRLDGRAYLSTIYSCQFIAKGLHSEQAGAQLAIMGNVADQLFYMASMDDRQADSRSLDIPSILVGATGRGWLLSKLAEGVLVRIGGSHSAGVANSASGAPRLAPRPSHHAAGHATQRRCEPRRSAAPTPPAAQRHAARAASS